MKVHRGFSVNWSRVSLALVPVFIVGGALGVYFGVAIGVLAQAPAGARIFLLSGVSLFTLGILLGASQFARSFACRSHRPGLPPGTIAVHPDRVVLGVGIGFLLLVNGGVFLFAAPSMDGLVAKNRTTMSWRREQLLAIWEVNKEYPAEFRVTDAWGRQTFYESDGVSFILVSFGQNGHPQCKYSIVLLRARKTVCDIGDDVVTTQDGFRSWRVAPGAER